MAKTLSEDLRVRVIASVDGGLSCREAAARFGIGVATAIRWVRVWRDPGATRAMPKGGDHRSKSIEAHAAAILAAVEAQKDITLVELAALLDREHGARCAPSTICRFFARHGISFKKNRARRRAGPTRCGGAAPGMVRRPA